MSAPFRVTTLHLSRSKKLHTGSGNLAMKKIRMLFSAVLELGITLDLIFLESRDLELCFAEKIIKIGNFSSSHEFFEN